jgi:hypothetical protein
MADEVEPPLDDQKRVAEIEKLKAETASLVERRPFELQKVRAELSAPTQAFRRQLVLALFGVVLPAAALTFSALQWIDANRSAAEKTRSEEVARSNAERALREKELFLRAFDQIAHAQPSVRATAALVLRRVAPPGSPDATIVVSALVQRLNYEQELVVIESLADTLASYGRVAQEQLQQVNQRASYDLARRLGAYVGSRLPVVKGHIEGDDTPARQREERLILTDVSIHLVKVGLPWDWSPSASRRLPTFVRTQVPELRVIRYGRFRQEYGRAIGDSQVRRSGKEKKIPEAERVLLLQSIEQSARLVAGTSLAIGVMMNAASKETGPRTEAKLDFSGIVLTRGDLIRRDLSVNVRAITDSIILVRLSESKLDSIDLSGSAILSNHSGASLKGAKLDRARLIGVGTYLRFLAGRSNGTCAPESEGHVRLPVLDSTDVSKVSLVDEAAEDDDGGDSDAEDSLQRTFCACFKQAVHGDRCKG